MTCPAVIEVVTPGPPGPPGSAVVLTGPAVLGRAQATSGAAAALPLGTGLSIVNGALTATGATNLSYDPATRLLSSSTGDDVTLPLVSTTAAGLVPSGWLTGAEPATLPHIHGALAGVVYEHVRNVSGATMAAMTPYHVVGSQGDTDRVQIVPADSSDPQTMPASGILMTALANNEDGHGVIAGVPTGLNTVANPSGTTLYVGSGVLTATAPAANVQAIAVVGRSHASTGTLSMLQGPSLALVAYTGAYAHLSGRPTLGTAAAAATSDFAPAAQGVSNGNSHDHSGGDGAQIAYSSLLGLPGNFTSGAAGLVPASGGGTSNFLRADGTFAAPSSGGTPGGTSGQMQFNNAGAFAGVAGSTVDPATGNTTFSARWIQSTNSAASAPATVLTGTWFTGGTTTTTKPHFLIEPAGTTSTAWSTAGTGLGVNAPSGFSGDLAWFGVNGNPAFRLTSGSEIIGQNGLCKLGLTSGIGAYLSVVGSYQLSVDSAGIGLRLGPGTPSVYLVPDAANTFAQRNGTAAQASRLYNTFTSDTNFERFNIRWTSNEAIIDTEAGSGGGTLRGLKIGSAATSLLGFYGATPVARPAAVADATDAATVITQLNTLLARIRTLGLIAT